MELKSHMIGEVTRSAEVAIANLGATGGNFTLPGYPTVQIVTDSR